MGCAAVRGVGRPPDPPAPLDAGASVHSTTAGAQTQPQHSPSTPGSSSEAGRSTPVVSPVASALEGTSSRKLIGRSAVHHLRKSAGGTPTASALKSQIMHVAPLDEMLSQMRDDDEIQGRRNNHHPGDDGAGISSSRHRRQSSETMLSRLVRGGSTLGMVIEHTFASTTSPLMTGTASAAAGANHAHHHNNSSNSSAANFFAGEEPISSAALTNFLHKANGDIISMEELDSLTQRKSSWWSDEDFYAYLYSAYNDFENRTALNEAQDMTRPLTEYFISASHNTYLVGGQYAVTGGRVDVNAYARALQQGCRCVEIDVYDGPDGDPIVMHVNSTVGGGACTFLEVVACIARDAFRGGFSQSPLFLNLENNMKTQTKRAAEIIVGAFGARILRSDDPEFGWEGRIQPPSPYDLAGRVVVRSKTRGAHSSYLDILYFVNAPWGNFFDAARPFCLSSSLAENKVGKVVKGARPSVTEINNAYLNRIYPKGTAVSSQNYAPLPFWIMGFQLVALNFQTAGLDLDVNRAMFARGGNSGFVLKPTIMRRSNTGVAIPQQPQQTALQQRETEGSAAGSDGGGGLDDGNEEANEEANEDDEDEDEEELDSETIELISILRAKDVAKFSRQRRKSTGSSLASSSRDLLGGEEMASLKLQLPPFEPRLPLPLASPAVNQRSLVGGGSEDSKLDRSSSSTMLPKIRERPMLEERSRSGREEKRRSTYSINSVEMTLVALKSNKSVVDKTGGGAGSIGGAGSVSSAGGGGSVRTSRWFAAVGGGGTGAALSSSGGDSTRNLHHHHHHHHDTGEDATSEHLHVELSIEGDERDRMVRRSSSTVCVKSDQRGVFADRDVLAVILNDSESALFTLKLVGDDGQVRACRSFFANCLSTGEFDLLMLGPHNQTSYTLTFSCNCVYSYLSTLSMRHVLFDAEEAPVLPLPSKIGCIEIFVISARPEVAGLDLVRCDPYVQVQMCGVPADARDIRTPRVSNCRLSSTALPQCEWAYYPMMLTVSWSEFAFLRISLRTFDSTVVAPSDQKRARRGSIVQSFSSQSHLIGRRTLWVEAIRPGYRAVQLFNQSDRLVCTLLCYFRIKDAKSGVFTVSSRTKFVEKLLVESDSMTSKGGLDEETLQSLGM